MTLATLFEDKTLKAKARVAQIGESLIAGSLPFDELLAFTEQQAKANRATCIEAIEYATRKQPQIADQKVLSFVTAALLEQEPRVKWESAKVMGNIAKLFPSRLSDAIENLLNNAKSDGAVVRWATAYALGEILKLKTDNNDALLPAIEKLSEEEEDSGVKKKYLDALKKARK